MELLEPACQQPLPPVAGDAASFVLSRLPHPDTAAADGAAFVDAATGSSLSFVALRRAALSLASGLRLGLGLRRGDAVLILSPNSLLLPQIVLGVLAAGGVVVVAAHPDATPAEISAAARASGAVIIVAAPEVAGKVAGAGVPLLLTSRSLDPRTLSAEELIDGGDPTALAAPKEEAAERSDVAFVAYSSASETVVMTHADLIAAAADVGLPGEGGRVCLASLPMCSVHGLSLLALALPAARVTTVLMPLPSDPRVAREAVAKHGATEVVATPEVAAVLAAPMPHDGKLSSLRRVIVAPVPRAAEARLEFRRRLPWVELIGTPEKETMPATEEVQMSPAELGAPVLTQTDAVPLQNNSQPADQMSVTRETATPVRRLKKVQKIILGDIFSRSNMTKNLTRKEADTCIRQAASKL